jgi:hypothetical protein
MGNWKQTDPFSEIIDSTDTLYLTYISVMRYGDVYGRLLIYFFLRCSKGNGVYYFIVIIRYKLLSLLDINKGFNWIIIISYTSNGGVCKGNNSLSYIQFILIITVMSS